MPHASHETTAQSRRQLLSRLLFGASGVGLRALATGVPVAVLQNPRRAMAAGLMCADKTAARFLIFSTTGAGDPMNANVPGMYDDPMIAHAEDPSMAATTFKMGGASVKGAQIWSTLPQWVLDRTNFIHHATLTNNHPNHGKVLQAMGSTTKGEMLPSIFAKHLAACFGTIQREPILVGTDNLLTFEGRALAGLPATGLRDLLSQPNTPLSNLQTLRDKSIDRLHALIKKDGHKAHAAYLDSVAMSRQQARSLSGDLVGMLGEITGNAAADQAIAAVALVRMNVSPVLTIRIPFGGDNHSDPDLMRGEVPQHISGVATIAALMERLKAAGVQDQVTFAAMNVFGRTLAKKGRTGRDHWGSHHATVLIGDRVRPGVTGGVEPRSKDFGAMAIDAKSGKGVPMGGQADVPFDHTLGAVAKTVGAALGVPRDYLDQQITRGKVIDGTLVG